MSELRLTLPITKVDAVQRLVYGLMTSAAIDKSDEALDYAASKPHFEAWSAEIARASDGKSFGNVRAMHGNVAAGILARPIRFDDALQQMECCAKIIDDQEWKKVEAGVYTGFSIGGAYVDRYREDGVTRYVARPSEVSLVDNPCNPDAVFQLVKRDGSTEARRFRGADAVLQGWLARDRSFHLTKAAALKRNEALDRPGETAAAQPSDISGPTMTELAKEGRRNSAADQKCLQAIHDHSVEMGAQCGCPAPVERDPDAPAEDELQKRAGDALVKRVEAELAARTEERDRLRGNLDRMTVTLDALAKRLETVERQPLPGRGVIVAIDKAKDTGVEPPAGSLLDGLAGVTDPREKANLLLSRAGYVPAEARR